MIQWAILHVMLCCAACGSSIQSAAGNDFADWGRQTLEIIERDHHREGLSGYYENQDKQGVAFAWDNSILLLAYAKATECDLCCEEPLDRLMQHLDHYWVVCKGIGGYAAVPNSKPVAERYYDDNAWIAMGQMDAWHATGRKQYLEAAARTLDFCRSGIDPESGGVWWRESWDRPSQKTKNTCSTAPVAFACLRYYEVTRQPTSLETAMNLMTWLDSHLKDEDGLYFDHMGMSGRIDRRKWSYNSAMPLRCYILLYKMTGRKDYLDKALQTAEASRRRWFNESTGAIHCESMFAFTLIEGWAELAEATGDRRWEDAARRAMRYVHEYVRDADGRYSKRWDDKNSTPVTHWRLLYPAAAARAYWVLAAEDGLDRTNHVVP